MPCLTSTVLTLCDYRDRTKVWQNQALHLRQTQVRAQGNLSGITRARLSVGVCSPRFANTGVAKLIRARYENRFVMFATMTFVGIAGAGIRQLAV